MGITRIVLEGHESEAFSVGASMRWRCALIGMLAGISLAVLFANICNASNGIASLVYNTFIAIGLTMVHVCYLYIVLNLLVFQNPIEKLYKQQLVYPVLLIVAYSFYALQVALHYSIDPDLFKYESLCKVISLSIFAFLYFLWLIRDYLVFKKTPCSDTAFWMGAESFSIICLVLSIVFEYNGVPEAFDNPFLLFLLSQNGPVFICALLFLGINFLSRLERRERTYVHLYGEYLRYNYLPGRKGKIKFDFPIDRIVDFGCGNGKRLEENLSFLDRIPNKKDIEVVGYDRREYFSGEFCSNVTNKTFKSVDFVSDMDDIRLDKNSLVIISHVLYEPATVSKVTRFLSRCPKGTFVLFRGASPNSFFVSTSFACSNAINRKNKCHLWYSVWLGQITGNIGMETVGAMKVRQNYELSNGGITAAYQLINLLYSVIFAKRLDDYFEQLRIYSNQDFVSNDDLIYLYKIGKE